ncbi:SMP-30/gluconolactonase/LRE family protein [Paracoccus pantotrophus]|uniref:SMP-30/gluconolactonase/LRE family protein n=1 Tax=Paracoccus pantotrophus TaxID=82367 RepID=UPI001C54D58D|nr:SMP-30/gluconolactonase/LRE family protein [Paracoccus pantotrophus]
MKQHTATKMAEDFVFLEGPKWHGDRLWVSDVFDHKIWCVALDGSRELVCEVPHRPSGLGFHPDGTPLVASSKDYRLYRIEAGQLVEHADFNGLVAGDVNDFAVDRAGRAYVGNFGYDYDGGAPRKDTDIHRVSLDGRIEVAASGLAFPNGMSILDGGRTLVVAETWACRLTGFDLSGDGQLSNRRVFADLGHRAPDGICADAEGAIWTACFNTGEFIRVLPGGEITDRIAFDGFGVSCTLGGRTGRRCSARSLAVHPRNWPRGDARRRFSALPSRSPPLRKALRRAPPGAFDRRMQRMLPVSGGFPQAGARYS